MASLPTIADIKAALGIEAGDTSKDAALTMNLAATIAIVERYCGRGLEVQDVVEAIEPTTTRNRRLMLYRFPVKHVTAVEIEQPPGSDTYAALAGWRAYKAQGCIEWRNGCGGFFPRFADDAVLRVTYTGGYGPDDWPADLVDALMRVFYTRWNASGGTGNAAQASTDLQIRAINVDGASIQYDNSSSSEFSIAERTDYPPELADVLALLEPYRDRTLGGV